MGNGLYFKFSIVVTAMMLLYGCSQEKQSLSSDEKSSFNITYSKKEIAVESSKSKVMNRFFFKDGEYFEASDSVLFFSVLRDTVLNIEHCGLDYKVIIKKDKDDQYKTSSYLVTDSGCLQFVISYSYDADYHITEIVRSAFVTYD